MQTLVERSNELSLYNKALEVLTDAALLGIQQCQYAVLVGTTYAGQSYCFFDGSSVVNYVAVGSIIRIEMPVQDYMHGGIEWETKWALPLDPKTVFAERYVGDIIDVQKSLMMQYRIKDE